MNPYEAAWKALLAEGVGMITPSSHEQARIKEIMRTLLLAVFEEDHQKNPSYYNRKFFPNDS